MTAVAAPYTLLRRAGETRFALADAFPGERRAGLSRHDVQRFIAERHFGLAFQPVVRLSDRTTICHEALLRLRPPPGFMTLPTRIFTAITAEFGLAEALDEAVLDVAIAAAGRAGGMAISVNVSAGSLASRACLARVLGRIAGDATALTLEVTDAAAVKAPADLATAVAILRRRGVRVCLDDFAADEVTLAVLKAVPFDQVKFSGSLLQAAVGGDRGRRLVRALLALAGAAGAESVAKQIETLPQAWLMQDLGVTLGQGWRFGTPGRLPTPPTPMRAAIAAA